LQIGTAWEYGMSIDWVGLVIEKVTGQKLGAYMQQHIFDPLGMHSTTFSLNEEHGTRRARMHLRAPDQHLSEIDPKNVYGDKVDFHLGGGTLLSYLV
jgi:methyl acetate hydrolase